MAGVPQMACWREFSIAIYNYVTSIWMAATEGNLKLPRTNQCCFSTQMWDNNLVLVNINIIIYNLVIV